MSPPANVCTVCGRTYEPQALFCPHDGAPLGPAAQSTRADPYLGVELAGQIRVEQLIGIGSMGRVYRAFQAGVERSVAVKILHRELSANETLVARFHREAKVASRLAHPNVVQILMTGQLAGEGPAGDAMYMAMEHLDGQSLRSALVAAGGAIGLARALHIALQVCDAVGEAHAQGVVHRDLKPENVMLVRRGSDTDFVKVLDFGIARLNWRDAPSMTQAGLVFGTARYVSPEGANGDPVGPRADVYAIATILYQMLAGRTPFEGESPMALLVQQKCAAPPPLRSLPRAAYVSPALEAVLMQNLAKDPNDRAADARALGFALMTAARAGGLSPTELLHRSTLLGQDKDPSPALASLDRTRQLDLVAGLGRPPTGASAAGPGGGEAGLADTRSSSEWRSDVSAPPSASQGLPPVRTVLGDGGPPWLLGPRPVDATLDDGPAFVPHLAPSAPPPLIERGRLLALVAVCFLGGALMAALVAHRLSIARHSSDPVPDNSAPTAIASSSGSVRSGQESGSSEVTSAAAEPPLVSRSPSARPPSSDGRDRLKTARPASEIGLDARGPSGGRSSAKPLDPRPPIRLDAGAPGAKWL